MRKIDKELIRTRTMIVYFETSPAIYIYIYFILSALSENTRFIATQVEMLQLMPDYRGFQFTEPVV